MAYIPNEWKDQVVQRPKTYQMNNNDDGSVTLIDSFGLVTELGTPVNEDYMNHIEQGIAGTGVRKYNTSETFNEGEWVLSENDGKLYKSLVANNKNNPITDITKWEEIPIDSDPDLSNLSSVGLDKINQSKALETGSVSSDADVYADIQKRAHSTFDKSKFKVVGSPTITDDGIVNKFTYTNYPSIANNVINKLENNSWKIRFAGISPQSNTTLNITGISAQATGKLNIGWINGTANFFLQIKNSTTEKAVHVTTNKPNTPFVGYAEFDGTNNYTIAISFDGGKTFSKNTMTAEEKVNFEGANLPIATGSDSVIGSIDLKSIAVWADGVPVFNGNKTGLYVAKSDNYEVVGSPTISDDGILTNCPSQNDYLSATIPSLSQFEKVRIEFELKVKEIPSGTRGIFNIPNDENPATANNGTYAWLSSNGFNINLAYNSGSDNGTASNNNCPVAVGDFIKVVAEGYKNSVGSFKVSKNNQAFSELPLTYANVCNFQEATKLFLGITGTGRQMQTVAEFDINSFKIYGDDNLIYQPCLKIPYTETFEHPNVVDVAYRNRVQDLYEQTGEALFYTIDEQNQNFTLPMGDIYGMITKNREILDIVYPIGRPMPEENNVLLDNEVWLEGATVNIVDYPKLFKVYGTKYGGDGTTTFKLPDMRGRTLWGSPDGSNGYIESKLPNIKGNVHLEGDGGSRAKQTSTASGAFNWINPGVGAAFENTGGGQPWFSDFNFDASRSSSIYSDSAKIVQPPAFKVRWKTRFE